MQANELELAIDVYKSLLSEGCTPNLVTFNTLIEVYSKTGAWQDAVSVLDALEAQARSSQGLWLSRGLRHGSTACWWLVPLPVQNPRQLVRRSCVKVPLGCAMPCAGRALLTNPCKELQRRRLRCQPARTNRDSDGP